MAQLLAATRARDDTTPRRSGPTGIVRDQAAPLPFPSSYTRRADEVQFSPQFTTRFEPDLHAFWMAWTPAPRPCFNPELLHDITRQADLLEACGGKILFEGVEHPVQYSIMTSATPGVFNMGGDLDLFARLIQAHDRAGLVDYGRLCVNVLHKNIMGFGGDITSIGLVQGECLGGGFEGALSNEIVIAEEHSRFGFPEILFNMFPGMGAYSLLLRRAGRRVADQLICSGERYSAVDMFTLGVIDAVVPTGKGEDAVRDCIRKRERNRNGLAGIAAARRTAQPLPYDELLGIVEVWADRALHLGDRDLRLMQRLAAKQHQ